MNGRLLSRNHIQKDQMAQEHVCHGITALSIVASGLRACRSILCIVTSTYSITVERSSAVEGAITLV